MSGPVRPEGLGPRGAAFWEYVTGSFELAFDEALLLAEACRTADTLDQLAEALAADGLLVGERVHPAVSAARNLRTELRALLAALALPHEGSEPVRGGRSTAASKAARSRWAGSPTMALIRGERRDDG